MRKTFAIFYIKLNPITIRKVMALDVGRFKYITAIFFNLRRLKRVSLLVWRTASGTLLKCAAARLV